MVNSHPFFILWIIKKKKNHARTPKGQQGRCYKKLTPMFFYVPCRFSAKLTSQIKVHRIIICRLNAQILTAFEYCWQLSFQLFRQGQLL